MSEFRMPSLGSDMDEGTLLEWKVAPGDTVHKGDILAIVDTDKTALDVEAFHEGVVEELLVETGTKVPVGTPIARLRELTGAPAPSAPMTTPPDTLTPQTAEAAGSEPTTTGTARPQPGHAPGPGRVTSPLVRQLAQDSHVDLSHVPPSGAGGVITRDDVQRVAGRPRLTPRARAIARRLGVDPVTLHPGGGGTAVTGADVEAAAPAAREGPPAVAEVDRKASMRRAIASLMARSNREIPHYHLATTIDLARVMRWLERRNAEVPVAARILPAALLLRAAALAARAVPECNGFYLDDGFHAADHVHLGMAIALRGGGLVTPAIQHADTLSLEDLAAAMKDLVLRARTGHLRASDVGEATITVTSLGDLGAEEVHGLIHPPQVALVGFGRIAMAPVVAGHQVVARPTVRATLAGDHRVSDGLHGGRFLHALTDHLTDVEE